MSSSNTSGGLIDFLAWVEANKTKVAAVAVALVVIIFAFAIMRYNEKQGRIEAGQALIALETPAGEDEPGPVASADYMEVAREYAGTSAGGQANLLAAGALFREGNYAEAEAEFSRLLADQGDQPWAPIAAYGQAAALEAQDKHAEAVNAYKVSINRYPRSHLIPQAQFALGRVYQATDQLQLALQIYNEMAAVTPPTLWNSQATMRREELLEAHPELRPTPTNAPPISLSTQPVSAPVPAPDAQPQAPANEAPSNEAPSEQPAGQPDEPAGTPIDSSPEQE